MKKNSNKGFVLAETLVVTVFLLAIFAMIYSNYFPLIGEFEKREVYDDVDSKYGVFWIKRLIEDPSYNIKKPVNTEDPRYDAKIKKGKYYYDKGYFRFECSDITDAQKRGVCISLVTALEISGCDTTTGDKCDIFVTQYKIGIVKNNFKSTVALNLKYKDEECYDGAACEETYVSECKKNNSDINTDPDKIDFNCRMKANKKVFKSGFQDYVFSLPDYQGANSSANYRVFVIFNHKRGGNDFLSYATIEVNKEVNRE